MNLAVKVEGLGREFRTHKRAQGGPNVLRALDGIDLEVRPGELFGLLGPNGAGKTTLIKILCTLLLPTSGRALVAGLDVATEPHRVRERINMVSGGEHSGYGILTVREHLWLFSQLYGVPTKLAHRRTDELLEALGLQAEAGQKISTLSTGMRQKMNLIRGFVCDPSILFLDEPTLGLDVQVAREVRTVVREWLAGSPEKTVLLTTHYMAEAEILCDRVAIISRGRVLACDTPENLKQRLDHEVVYRVETDLMLDPGDPFLEVRGVRRFGAEHKAGAGTTRFMVIMDRGSEVSGVVDRLKQMGRQVRAVNRAEPSLEDVFLHIVGKTIGEDEDATED
jgi:ABC-2 type transport system ATP-binding protein